MPFARRISSASIGMLAQTHALAMNGESGGAMSLGEGGRRGRRGGGGGGGGGQEHACPLTRSPHSGRDPGAMQGHEHTLHDDVQDPCTLASQPPFPPQNHLGLETGGGGGGGGGCEG